MTPTASNRQFNPVRDNNTNERCPTQATVSHDAGKVSAQLAS